jgi:hypothetical protein
MIRMAKAKAQKDVLIINYEQWFWLVSELAWFELAIDWQ